MRVKKNLIEQWLDETSRMLVKENLKIIADMPIPTVTNEDLHKTLSVHFLQMYIETLVGAALNDYKGRKMDNTEAYEHTKIELNQIKADIQNAVCVGFEKAFKRFSGVDNEYYCLIAPMPPVANKEPI